MKFAELKDLTVQELSARSSDLRRELFNLRLQKATAQLEKTSRLRVLRKDIASKPPSPNAAIHPLPPYDGYSPDHARSKGTHRRGHLR
jgi:large subunit ribosomal protein L29